MSWKMKSSGSSTEAVPNLPTMRLYELRRHANHLRELRPRVLHPEILNTNLTLRNNVLFSWLIVCQILLDIASDFSVRRGLPFDDYQNAMQNLTSYPEFPTSLLRELEWLPEFHDQLLLGGAFKLDMGQVMQAFDHLGSIEQLSEIMQQFEAGA